MLASLIGLFCGARHRSPLLRKISFAGYNKRFGKGCDENAWLSRDESVVKAYHDDPLCGFVFTASAYRDLFDLLGRISRKEWANGIKKDLPLLLISGEDDPVGGFGAGVQKIANRLTGAGGTDVTLKLDPERRHEILDEQSCRTVGEDVF